jgi:HD superfamily phosphodiesterase
MFSNGQGSAGMTIPDSKLARDATELVRESTTDLIYRHSRRVFWYGNWHGRSQGLSFDPELLYVAAMFHDLGLNERFRSSGQRFEVDGADEARRFLQGHGVPEERIRRVWTAIARHTTPAVREFMDPEVALVAAGVEYDVLGIGYHGRSAPTWVRGW